MHYVGPAEVLDFVGRARCAELAARGTTCPDHFLRTKVRPLFVPFDPAQETADDLLARLPALVEQLPRGLRRLLRALQAGRLARRCATPTRCWC